MLGAYRKKSLDDTVDNSEGALPFALQRIAEEELGETPSRRKDALEKLSWLVSGEWIPSELPFPELHKAWAICADYVASDPVTQVLGVVLLFDFRGFTIDKLFSVNIGLVKKSLEYVQVTEPNVILA
ncbi:hypothetical protein MTO96_036797 [Rhipicephalus appendiculatus]